MQKLFVSGCNRQSRFYDKKTNKWTSIAYMIESREKMQLVQFLKVKQLCPEVSEEKFFQTEFILDMEGILVSRLLLWSYIPLRLMTFMKTNGLIFLVCYQEEVIILQLVSVIRCLWLVVVVTILKYFIMSLEISRILKLFRNG